MTTAPSPAPTQGASGGAYVRTVALSAAARRLLAARAGAPSVAWLTGATAERTGFVGWGEAARLEVSGPERFSRAQRWWTAWTGAAEVSGADDEPGTGPIAFCSFAFDPDSPVPSVVVVPEVLVVTRGGRTWVTVTSIDADRAEALLADTLAPASVPDPRESAAAPVSWAEGSRTALQWQAAVSTAAERIVAGELDKVVLARDVVATCHGGVDVRRLLARLVDAYPSCWTYVVAGLVGATPELLVRRIGDTVTSRVLAGTMARSPDSGRDASLASALLASAKDHAEHRYAVQSVAAALAAHCTDLAVPAAPSLLRLANVQHLATDVSGSLVDGAPVLALAAALHPTAAVCGTPTERALAVIRELEGMERGRYAGPVGWTDARGDGELGIALRCGQVEGDALRLYAGCGIVVGSDPETELAESQAKLVAMRDALEAG